MKQTILIVEDEAVMRTVLADKFKSEGYEVLEAGNGAEGLKTALALSPDLILLDNRMPEMSGYQMLHKLRDSGSWGERVPVLFFSNVEPASSEERNDIEAIAPVAYILKSENGLADIASKVHEILG
jgi:CheY-like chemotaxis protein